MRKYNKIKHLDGYDLPIGDVLLGIGFLAIGGVSVFLLIASLIV